MSNLHISAFIPEQYVPDVNARLTLYKRLASCENEHEIQELKAEMIDRFGLLPEVTQQLFAVTQLKLLTAGLGINKIEVIGSYGYLHFNEKPSVDPQKIIRLIQTQPKNYQLQGANVLRFRLSSEDVMQRIALVTQAIEKIL